MDEQEIKTKLNALADYQAHRDLLEADKRALLEEVKVPDEVQAIVSAGMKRMSEAEMSFIPAINALIETEKADLAAIVVPEEIKAALAEIDRKRDEVSKAKEEKSAEIRKQIQVARAQIQAEVEAATQGVYTALQQRKAEIEAEFAGKAGAVDENIKKLTEEIKKDIAVFGLTVKGQFLMGTYGEGRKTWIPKRLDKYTETHPDIKECYTVGEPIVTIRRI